MCGIAGVYGERKSALALDAAIGAMAHRGPDGSGSWTCREGHVELAHTRLAIQGLAAWLRCTLIVEIRVTYNGEISTLQVASLWVKC